MKNKQIILIICLAIVISYFMPCWADDEEIFSDYCNPELCKFAKNASHTGCKDGKLHDGQFQVPPCTSGLNKIMNLTDAMKQEILDMHNYQRNYVACGGLQKSVKLKPACRMGVLRWDKDLEATALLHVTYCTMEHDKCRGTLKYLFSGQNLGYMSGQRMRNLSVYTTLHMYEWYMEYKLTWPEVVYDYFSKPDNPMIGHFLTAVNQYNNRIGCVLGDIFETTQQAQSIMLTCNYPMTNVKKFTTYAPCKVPASECVTGTDSQYKYLCSEDEEYPYSKPAKSKPYDGEDTDTFDDCGPAPEDVYKINTNNIFAADANMPPIDESNAGDSGKPPDTGGKPPDTGGEPPDTGGETDTGGEPDMGGKPPAAVDPEECEPTKKPRPQKIWPAPPAKPSDSIVYDYEEEEYDPPYSSSPPTFKACFLQNTFSKALNLAILFFINIFGI